MFPVYASGGLFGLYLFFKVCVCVCVCVWRGVSSEKEACYVSQVLPKEYVNMTLSVLFLGLGVSALTRVLR